MNILGCFHSCGAGSWRPGRPVQHRAASYGAVALLSFLLAVHDHGARISHLILVKGVELCKIYLDREARPSRALVLHSSSPLSCVDLLVSFPLCTSRSFPTSSPGRSFFLFFSISSSLLLLSSSSVALLLFLSRAPLSTPLALLEFLPEEFL